MNLKFMRGMNLREQKKCGVLLITLGMAIAATALGMGALLKMVSLSNGINPFTFF